MGTRVLSADYAHFTAEQLETLEGMKDRRYAEGIAAAEHVNKIVRPDGSVDTDLESVNTAVKAQLQAILAGDTSDPDTLRQAELAARKVREVPDHIARNRFVFVVDDAGAPVVYFPCATEQNPELPRLATPEDEEYLAGVRDKMAKIISDARGVAQPAAAEPQG